MAPLALLPAAERPLDFWDEEIRLFGVSQQNQHIDTGLSQRLNPNYGYNRATSGFDLDHSDKRVGDLSIRYTPAAAGMAPRFGFVADLWGGHWQLTPARALHLWVKVVGKNAPAQWNVILVDNAGRTAGGILAGTATGGEWQAVSLPLAQLTTASGFNWGAVALCEFEAAFGKDARLHLDGIRFEGSGTYIGVTDKPLAQRQVEAKASRTARVEELKKSSVQKDYWSLLHTPLFCRFYYWFSNRRGRLPGRMQPEVEKLLLETLWERTAIKNDIHWSRQSTWWLDGSENHDLNAKACNLITSRIFMEEPAYRDRVYPDYGFGGGWSYWNQINDCELPALVWRMALDREGMGAFVYRSRGIGEEENIWPRPLGTERSLTIDTESRFLNYTWVTPDYTLGTGVQATFNAANTEIPTVGGEPVNYRHPQTFDSPYLKSPYKSGKIALAFGGERFELDFSDRP